MNKVAPCNPMWLVAGKQLESKNLVAFCCCLAKRIVAASQDRQLVMPDIKLSVNSSTLEACRKSRRCLFFEEIVMISSDRFR